MDGGAALSLDLLFTLIREDHDWAGSSRLGQYTLSIFFKHTGYKPGDCGFPSCSSDTNAQRDFFEKGSQINFFSQKKENKKN